MEATKKEKEVKKEPTLAKAYEESESAGKMTKEDREMLNYVFKAARAWTVTNIADDEDSLLFMHHLKTKILKLWNQ